ncbi:hypothetical protein U1701_07055 [Sphingomonas sp. PB2P19]|uniref:hypothetical protein n=1 Tax=Sphingomonas rhamnosi TaxID=3096156 RepID=UPI002FC8CD64
MTKADVITAAGKHGVDAKAVEAVFAALRASPTSVLVFRETEGRSVAADKRKTIFMCG